MPHRRRFVSPASITGNFRQLALKPTTSRSNSSCTPITSDPGNAFKPAALSNRDHILSSTGCCRLHPPMYGIDPPPSDSDAEQSNDSLAMDESGVCILPTAASAPCRHAPTAVPSKEGKREEIAPAAAPALW